MRGKRVAGLGPAQPGSPPVAYWTTYLSSADVDAHAAAIADAGGTVMFGPMDVMGQGRMLIAADPEGAMFGIWQPQAHKGAQLVNENAALDVEPADVAQHRRRRALPRLGVPRTRSRTLPEMPFDAYQLFKVGDAVGGMFAMPDDVPAEAPPHWLAYFWLDDVDAGAERARDARRRSAARAGGLAVRALGRLRTRRARLLPDPRRDALTDGGPARRGLRKSRLARAGQAPAGCCRRRRGSAP